ncbi:HD-GYP domain-containing protein [Treponema pedis]|uniref:HD-GYP domain-containing protein n=1 Tax=Treponema pedis TaxID=409322 RepID=UPI0019810368|nr:HD-GYP domain-containing protein [Treponema pedis]QSI04453.1 HD-GYP domain-containing protein [Treponema pedis]
MLKKIKVSELKIGSRYSAPILFDDGQNMLLAENSPVTEYEINVLKRWKIPYVITAGEIIPPGMKKRSDIAAAEADKLLNNADTVEELEDIQEVEELSEVEELESATAPQETDQVVISGTTITKNEIINVSHESVLKICSDIKSKELYKTYSKLIYDINDFFEKLKHRQPVANLAVNPYAEIILNLIKQDSPLCVSFILSTELEENNLARSSVNTAILAVIIAEALELSEKQIKDVAIAAILHDIGMMKIPETIVNKHDALNDVEKQAVAAHTAYGYKTALNELMYTKEIAKSIMQHHERWDGKGIPNGVAGEDIDLGARIITVADAFVAMISPKPYRDFMLGYQAMKNLLADNARIFDPSIIKVMIKSIGIYPIGSLVLMNDASLARVVQSSPDAPMRPCIKILIDETGELLADTDTIIDLSQNKNLFIVRAINPREYTKK